MKKINPFKKTTALGFSISQLFKFPLLFEAPLFWGVSFKFEE
jgi:hypothetical protein